MHNYAKLWLSLRNVEAQRRINRQRIETESKPDVAM